MNAMNMAKTAYATNQAPIRTPRGTEYEAFARVTRRLKAASELGRPGFARLAEALHLNRQLWTMLAADVAERENGLPEDLRARIFYLSEFTAQHSRKVLRQEEDVAVLLEVNMAVMRGLRTKEQAA
ncbi:MAG: flagellar biosynthesis regulator FlhF [Maritimibacter sp.]|nr:flagellar biosynthesis regulator FlaF [Maritimibacter sp. UBA3975]MAM61840.1 flagellar biosynthesis regulator FlhF [Maritimibacter sp.]